MVLVGGGEIKFKRNCFRIFFFSLAEIDGVAIAKSSRDGLKCYWFYSLFFAMGCDSFYNIFAKRKTKLLIARKCKFNSFSLHLTTFHIPDIKFYHKANVK